MADGLKVGVATDETWSFLDDVYAELSAHHQVRVFERRTISTPAFNTRLNRSLFRQDIGSFLRGSDVVFFEWASGLLAETTRLPKTCAIVTRLHRYEMYRWADKINWDAVDAIILVSEAKRREFVRRFPEQAGKIAVIPEAISPARFQPIHRPFRGDIGILCHLRPRKRVYDLILAFSELLRVRPYLRLHVGGGEAPGFEEYAAALASLVERLELQDCVTLHGHVNDPAAWCQNIDILVSNSYSEGLQVSLLEAMAMRRYCLSHHWDGAEELLPPENLHYTDRELQDNILRYCDLEETEREALQDRMRAIVAERFDVTQTGPQIRAVIEEAAARREKERAARP
jgi:glycosyltransferase involved in cell wall biosynthesis